MSSFNFGVCLEDSEGIWLRFQECPDIMKEIKKRKLKRPFDTIERVVVSEYDEKTRRVWFHVWCKSVIDSIMKKNRYNVFTINLPHNKDWVCEGDLGKGKDIIKFTN
jgi:hypothetical protein